MNTAPERLVTLARTLSIAHGLDPSLVCAVIEQESAWNPWAIRYEPAFFAKYVAPLYTNNKISATEAYARGMSWGLCIAEGELVSTEHGWCPIETVQPGTRVLNRQGQFTSVNATLRKSPASCLEISLALNPPLCATPNHRVFARKAALSKWHTGRNKVSYEKHPDYVAAGDLASWDQVAFPRSTPTICVESVDASDYLKCQGGFRNGIEYRISEDWIVVAYKGGRERSKVKRHMQVNKELLELLGLYAAEGHRLEKGKGCAFSFHKSETYLHARVIELATAVFGEEPRHGIQEYGNGVQISLYGPGPRFLTELIPGTAATKAIPGWLLSLPAELQKFLFLGAFLGDGCRKFAKLTTASPHIAYAMSHILLRLGIVSRISRVGREARTWFDVSLNSHSAVDTLNGHFRGLVSWPQTATYGIQRRNSTHWDQDLDFIYFPVRSVKTLAPRPVFDLDAGEDASFCVGRSIVHNCQVMGQVARENGFSDRFLSGLCDPAAGIDIGCRVLRKKLDSASGDVTKGLLAWNGGANPNYPVEVLARRSAYSSL